MPFNSGVGGNKVVPFYGGGQVPNPVNVQVSSTNTAPSSNAIGTAIGDLYITANGTVYMCVKNTGVKGTVTWVQVALSTGALDELTPDSGTIPVTPVTGNINLTGGTGVNTVGTAGVITFNVVGGGLKTTVSTTTPSTLAPNTRLVTNTAGLYTANMPTTAVVGDIFEVMGNGAGGWLIQAAAGQTINSSGGSTTVAGSLASTNRYDTVRFVCVVANTTFTVESINGVLTNA